MKNFVKRQMRTMCLLLAAIVLLTGAGAYVHWLNSYEYLSQPLEATDEDLTQAVMVYKRLAADAGAQLRTGAAAEVGERVEIVFTGMAGVETVQMLTDVLLEKQLHAMFFITEAEAEQYPDSIALLLRNDFEIGLLGDGVNTAFNETDENALVEQLCRATVKIRSRYGVRCKQALVTAAPETNGLRAAMACGVDEVLVSDNTLALAECTSVEAAAEKLAAYPRGSILAARLNGTESIGQTLVNLITALENSNLLAAAKAQLAALPENQEPPEAMQRIYTTEKAVCFTFAGLGNSEELTHLLAKLAEQGGKATFFVDYQELAKYADDVRRIQAAGHELGIKATSDLLTDPVQVLYELMAAEELLQEQYDCQGELLVRAGSGRPGTVLRRAAYAGGYTVLSNILTPVQEDDVRATDMMAVLEKVMPADKRVLQRGEIIHFPMNYYHNSDTLLGDLAAAIMTERNVYPLRTATAVLSNEEKCYTYPVPADKIPANVKDRIHPGQLTQDIMEVFPGRYIGTDWINSTQTLPGFTQAEIEQLDVVGLIPNESNMVFLTFDDWGGDANLTKILDVLNKHGAKATFFVYTENVVNNPNLLRSIAVEGHALASHTHYHIPLSNVGNETQRYVALQPKQVEDLREDLVLSYQAMQEIAGDVLVDGVPTLTPYFRPPTLALSREGVEAVYDAGYTWIVSGSYSTDDYIATDVQSLVDGMKTGTRSGAVLVMHMTDSSIYTADALDQYLTEMTDSGYRFVTITEALGLD